MVMSNLGFYFRSVGTIINLNSPILILVFPGAGSKKLIQIIHKPSKKYKIHSKVFISFWLFTIDSARNVWVKFTVAPHTISHFQIQQVLVSALTIEKLQSLHSSPTRILIQFFQFNFSRFMSCMREQSDRMKSELKVTGVKHSAKSTWNI